FFFQAEDGIRDFHVTGVQTCALPILRSPGAVEARLAREALPEEITRPLAALREGITTEYGRLQEAVARLDATLVRPVESTRNARSEERRVGKERRARGTP